MSRKRSGRQHGSALLTRTEFCRALAGGAVALMAGPTIGHAESALDALVENAKKESELSFVAAGTAFGGVDGMSKFEAGFNKKFGTSMKFRFTPGPSMPAVAARVYQEFKAGVKATTDVFLGPPLSYSFLTKQDVLAEVKWAETFPWVTPEMEISKNRGVLACTGISAIVYNPAMLGSAEPPKNNEDLVDPVKSKAWAGKMAVPPYPDWLVELQLVWPKEKILDFAKKLAPLTSGFIRYGEIERLVNGEFVLMANEGDGPQAKAMWASKGAQIDFSVGNDPAFAFYYQLGVPKNASSPNLAKLFAAFVASPEGQAILEAVDFQSSHLVPGTSVAKLIAAKNIKLVPPERILAFYDKGGDPDLTAQINKIFGR